MTNLKEKAVNLVDKVKTYWKTPPLGNYMTFKEITALAGGGIGIKMITTIVALFLLSASNFIVGNVIGIDPTPMYVIYMISIIAGFPLTMVRAKIIDNTRSKKGKYRPYLISMGIPTSILAILYVWAPYELIDKAYSGTHFDFFGYDLTLAMLIKCAIVLVINIGFQFFYNFLYDAYDNYIVVLSPNTQERTNVLAVKNVTDSLAPSIYNIVIPLIAKAITGTNTLTDIRIYRYAVPPMIIGGMLLAVVVYANTREKIVQAKTHVAQMKFVDAVREVGKNKYFWIIACAGWVAFLEAAYYVILQWIYSYQDVCSAGEYTLVTTIYGNASFWGMVASPFFIKRYGKKKVLIFTNFLNIIFIAALWPSVMYAGKETVIWFILLFLFLNGVVGAFAHILTPSLNGDIRDFQQYVSGERIDGMFAAVGLISSVIALLTGSILPDLYTRGGINSEMLNQYAPQIKEIMASRGLEVPDVLTNTYDVLYIPDIFNNVIGILILASVIGAALNVIPYFFYDLSELKQQAIVKVLKVRALFEDFGNNALKDEELVETIELVRYSRAMAQEQEKPVSKEILKKAKKKMKAASDKKKAKEEYKAVKNELKENKTFNESIYISKFVVDELDKFDNPLGMHKYEVSRQIVAEGYEGIININPAEWREKLAEARKLPKSTAEEKEYRKFEIETAKNKILSKKYMDKYFKGNIPQAPDSAKFTEDVKAYDDIENKIAELYVLKSDAAKAKDKDGVKKYSEELKALKQQMKAVDKSINDYMEEECMFNRAIKSYYQAKKVVTQYEDYQHFDEIEAMYDEAKERADKAKAEEIERLHELEIKEKEYAAQLKAGKKNKKNKK